MTNSHVGSFDISADDYLLFRFQLRYPCELLIRMIATAPVNMMLLNPREREEYKQGRSSFRAFTATWGSRSELETSIKVDNPGTWYLLVEGSTEPSRGKIEVLSNEAAMAR